MYIINKRDQRKAFKLVQTFNQQIMYFSLTSFTTNRFFITSRKLKSQQ